MIKGKIVIKNNACYRKFLITLCWPRNDEYVRPYQLYFVKRCSITSTVLSCVKNKKMRYYVNDRKKRC